MSKKISPPGPAAEAHKGSPACKHDDHHNHHNHDHHHHHGASDNLKLAFFLNLIFAIIEIVGGFYTNSIAILSDALHDFGDSLAIGFAWYMENLSHKGRDHRFSYGYRRFSTLGALIIGLVLILSSVLILVKAVPRLLVPEPTETVGMFFLAFLGIAVNGFAAYRVSKGKSLNEKMVSWHLIEDLIGWVLVLMGAVIIHIWKWYQVDAGLAIVLALWIVYNVFNNLRQTVRVFLQATPDHLRLEHFEEAIQEIQNVQEIHHSHLWSLDGDKHIFTTHIVVDANLTLTEIEDIKRAVKDFLRHKGVFESNIEIESSDVHCMDPEHI